MALQNGAGTDYTKATLEAATTVVATVDGVPTVRVATADVYETYTHPGSSIVYKRLKYKANASRIRQSEINNLFDTAQAIVTTIEPGTGPAAGGNTVTVRGHNLVAGLTLTLGGATVATYTVVNPTRITFVAPALARGSYSVRVVDAQGRVSSVGGYTSI